MIEIILKNYLYWNAIKNYNVKTVFDLISISWNDIIYFTRSILPDLQEECNNVELNKMILKYHENQMNKT